jgi:hypothetical protein
MSDLRKAGNVWARVLAEAKEMAKAEKKAGALQSVVLQPQAPAVLVPSGLNELKETVRQKMGNYGAKRVERAADEIKNLERLYTTDALKEAFIGDNARALMTMNPSDFERYATPIPKGISGPQEFRGFGNQFHDESMKNMTLSDYLDNLANVKGGFADVPYLIINKEEQGLPLTPFISGHEGRHRNRALAKQGEEAGLVKLLPRSELREPFPRRDQEEYIDALKKELGMTDNLVLPQKYNEATESLFDKEIQRPAIKLPDIYAEGGVIHKMDGGKITRGLMGALTKAKEMAQAEKTAAKAIKGAQDILPAAEREANLAKFLKPSAEKRRMYHGSKEPNIKEFKTKKDLTDENNMTGHYADERDAVFLAPEPEFTTHFSKEGYTDTHQAPTTYPVYVQVEKPFDFDNPDHLRQVKETYLDMYHNPESELYDPHLLPSERSMAQHRFNKKVDALQEDENNWPKIENAEFQEVLKDLGFDSFYTRERGSKNLGVYDPSRIKSALGNRGTYDMSEPDINKAKGGVLHMADAGRVTKPKKPHWYDDFHRRMAKGGVVFTDKDAVDNFLMVRHKAEGGDADDVSVKDIARNLGKLAKEQGKEELLSLKKPRAITDIGNRGILAPALGSPVDLINMGLSGIDTLTARSSNPTRLSSEKPFGGQEYFKDLMNEYGVTSGEDRPMMETTLSFFSPTGMIKGVQKTGELAKKLPDFVRKIESGLGSLSKKH